MLAFDFFREFARCEYCLKATGIIQNKRDATPDWKSFATQVNQILENPVSAELKEAITYYKVHPPKKQVVNDNLLIWDATLPDHKCLAELILLLVCRVRNNLFHGGKFNGHWFEPQRSNELLQHALVILKACIEGHSQVREAYHYKAA